MSENIPFNDPEKSNSNEYHWDPKEIDFSLANNYLNIILAYQEKVKQNITKFFNELKNWNFTTIPNFDYKNSKDMDVMKLYIMDPQNKNNVLDAYLFLEKNIQLWSPNDNEISNLLTNIQDVYPCELIWEYELQKLFPRKDSIIALWNEIFDWKWNWEDISTDNLIWMQITSVASETQFIKEFNKRNQERKQINILELQKINEIDIQWLNFSKNARILYLDWNEINNDNLLDNEAICSKIKEQLHNNTEYMEANNNEFLNDILKINVENKNNIYKNIYDQIEEQNENYKFHDTWLNFMTELELKDEETILSNFIKITKPNQSIEEARAKNPDLTKIMAELVIKEDDTPDTKYEKSKLIYLLNNGLFRWFLMAIDCLKPDGVDGVKSSPYLKPFTFKWDEYNPYESLVNHLNRYQTEKDEKFYELINDINNLDINFDSDIIKHSSLRQDWKIWPHLKNPWTKWDIEQIVGLAKSFFIQRIKDGQTKNTNIETYKNQLAYILATMQFECGYNHKAVNKNIYYWYGQIDGWYTWLWEIFAQWSWLDIWLRDNKGNPIVWPDIKVTKASLTEKNFAGYAFVYGLTYWHLSNQWNLDDYINDSNIKNPNYKGARRVEAGAYSDCYGAVANEWRKIIDDSILNK